jgi:hypothetical protein
MSSHHFVREGQEPALLIIEPVPFAVAESLLEWAPLVVVTQNTIHDVLLWGIKIDVVISRQHEIASLQEKLVEQTPVKILPAGEDLLESSLLFLTGMGEKAVSIICHKFSEQIREKLAAYGPRIQITVRESTRKWSLIESGNYRKWFQKDSLLYFLDPTLVSQVQNLLPMADGFKITEDQWVNLENDKSFWVGEGI